MKEKQKMHAGRIIQGEEDLCAQPFGLDTRSRLIHGLHSLRPKFGAALEKRVYCYICDRSFITHNRLRLSLH